MAEPAPKFDPRPWLEDFTALKTGMEVRYANLAWFASPQSGVDLPVTPLKDESPRARAARLAETIADDLAKAR
jgi:hypothetical protein